MAVTTLVPLDESTEVCPESLIFGGEGFAGIPDDPPPTPGDPDVERIPAVPSRYGRRVQALLCTPVHHDPLAELRTASVDSWTDRFGVGSMSMTVDTHDPSWAYVAASTTQVRGRTVRRPDLKSVELSIGLEGSRTWSGVIQNPTGWGDGRIKIEAASFEAVWDERTLGETQQRDYYDGRGAFPDDSLAGWEFEPHIAQSWNLSTAYEGGRSLRIEAVGHGGWSYGPWVLMPGQAGSTRYPVGSALAKAPEGTVVTVGCFVELLDGTKINPDFTKDSFGQSDDGDTRWQGPIAGRGRLTPNAVDHKVRVGIYIPRNHPVDIDLVRLQWPTLTGFPSDRDLSYYPGRILRDAQFGPGGSSWGFSTSVASLTGIEDKITWPHQDDHPVGEAISTVQDMLGGPDVRMTPRGRCVVERRRGQDRRDISLTPDRIIECSMTVDPGGQIDELRGLTDIGSASYRHVFGVNAPAVGDRRRIRQLVQVPNGLSYDAARRWTLGQAEFAARTPFTATVTVDFDYGARFAVGDGVLFAYDDGELAWWGNVRVGARTMQPKTNRCILEVGTDPVVAL